MTDAPSVLTERQLRIVGRLDGKRPELASMYRTAIALLHAPSVAGDERVRVSLICHAVRELMNRLPEAIGMSADRKRGQRSRDHVDRLPALASQFPSLDLLQDVENVPVPQKLAVFLDELIKVAVQEDGRIVGGIAALLTDDGNTKHPAVRDWRKLSRWFTTWAHLGDEQSAADEVPSDEELTTNLNAVEEMIDGVLSPFFDSLRAIDDLLAEANRLVGGGAT